MKQFTPTKVDLNSLDLNTHERAVYDYLQRCDRENDRYQGYADIAKGCGISKSTVAKCVKSLNRKGVIHVESNRHWGAVPNFYRVNYFLEAV